MAATLMLPVCLVTSLPGYLLAQAEPPLEVTVLGSGAAAPNLLAALDASTTQIAPTSDVLLAAADAGTLPLKQTSDHRPAPALPVAPVRFSDSPTKAEILAKGGLMEPLVPTGQTKPSAAENKALATALNAYRTTKAGNPEDVSALTSFLATHPKSPWRAAVLTNVGLIYRQTGYYTRALDAWEGAYALASTDPAPTATSLADRALSELSELNSRLGRQDRLKELLDQAGQRHAKGSVANRINGAKTGLWLMQNEPAISFKCGPYALERILASQKALVGAKAKTIHEAQSTVQGTSLVQVAQLAQTLGMNYQMAKRQPGSGVIVPAVVHWKAGHFAAIVRQLGSGKYWLEDPTFGTGIQVSQAALDEEASGYFLVPAQQELPAGWQNVQVQEGQNVWGKGSVNGQDPGAGCPCTDLTSGGNSGGGDGGCAGCGEGANAGAANVGMPRYDVFTMPVSVHISDTPVGYSPPVGPSVYATVSYNQYESNQLAGFQYSNFGPLWNFNWLSYINFDLSNNAYVHMPGGGTITFSYSAFDFTTNTYGVNSLGQTVLEKLNSTSYALHFTDGSTMIFDVPDASGNVFLSGLVDSHANIVNLNYQAVAAGGFCINSITDAMGQVTSFEYGLATNPYKITKITDPFGRFASFGYTLAGNDYQLTSITDAIGMVSQFTYSNSTVQTLVTPYGTTVFNSSTLPGNSSVRVLEVVDPAGAKERWESWLTGAPVPDSDPVAPTNIAVTNQFLTARDTFYWSKKAMLDAPSPAYGNAVVYHFLHDTLELEGRTLESIKKPLENRVWFLYPGQNWSIFEGTSDRPVATARVLDDGSQQISQSQYSPDNTQLISTTDPAGRTTLYDYDTNGVDLLMKRQATSSSTSVVLEKRVYDPTYPPHCPKQVIDASGQPTAYTYDAFGRTLTVTNAKNEVTTYSYTRPYTGAGPADGYLYSVTGSVPGATTAYTYDAVGRRVTATDSEGYELGLTYDALDRLLTTTYPDSTYTQLIYNRLDVEWTRDRLGRWTHHFYDSLRHLVASQDSLGRLTNYGYCLCGALTSMTDPAGNVTRWTQDIQGRRVSKTYADGSGMYYAYENTTSRIKNITDALQQIKEYAYYIDNKLAQTSYVHAVRATPTVNFTYDPVYDRLVTIGDDATGVTTYNYNSYSPYTASSNWPNGATTGAGKVVGETRAGSYGFASYTVSYAYDELGRQVNGAIDGANNQTNISYDSLGRIYNITNLLGSFGYTYTTATSSDVALTYLGNSGGPQIAYSYYPNNGDRRIQTINNLSPSGSTISRYDYSYNAVGDITNWTQQASTKAPQAYNLTYDASDQLTVAILTDTSNQTAISTHVYGYDQAANRVSEQNDLHVTSATPNELNEITATSAGGPLLFSGTTSQPSTVTIGGNAAQVDGNQFAGYVNVIPGSNTVTVKATSQNAQVTTNNYQVQIASVSGGVLTYDLNGNLTDDGNGKSYEWDAANRLEAINYLGTSNRTEFAYDWSSRCVQIVEKTGGAVVTSKNLVWQHSDSRPSEERDSSNSVTKRFYEQGEQIGGTVLFSVRDHLGSVRSLIDIAGNAHATYNYDPFGRRTKVVGDQESDFGFTGYYFHQSSGLNITVHRDYDPNQGRWLSRDPLPKLQGNLYDYVENDTVNRIDPSGLISLPTEIPYVHVVIAHTPLLCVYVCYVYGYAENLRHQPLRLAVELTLLDAKMQVDGFNSDYESFSAHCAELDALFQKYL